MKLLIAYLRRQRHWLALYILIAGIFAVVFYLHDVPPMALSYALLLCGVALALALGGGFFLWRRRHLALADKLRAEALTAERLPEALDLVEEDYQTLYREALRSKTLALDRRDQQEKDLTEYYTLWVHQIKTPISAMRLLLQGEDTALSRELEAQLFRISQYVEMALAYLRMGSDSRDYVLRPCLLEPVVKQSVKKFAPLFIRSRIKLELGDLSATVVTDEKWLAFCLEQLLANAIQYAPRGTVTVECRDGRLVVRDTGIGIAPEDLPRVFEKGYTGLNGRREKQATGIGLYLCRRILTTLGHTISIASEIGRGTEVTISFPQPSEVWE